MQEDQIPAPEAGDEGVLSDEVEFKTTRQAPEPPKPEEKPEEQTGNEPEQTENEDPPAEEEISKSKARRMKRQEVIDGFKEEAATKASRLERLQKQLETSEPPKEADFEDYEDFRIARVIHDSKAKDQRAELDEGQGEVRELQQQAAREAQESFSDAEIEARIKYQDYDAVARNDNLPVSPAMGQAILEMDNGPDVLYHLGANPRSAMDIAKMSPARAMVELGRLSATLTAPAPITETSAPEPIKPVRPSGRTQKSPANMTMAEYRKWVATR